MTGDDAFFDGLRRQVQLLNRDAFRLARMRSDDDLARAEKLNEQLTALIEPLQALPPDQLAAVLEEWNDARLDLAWVLAGRVGPMSSRTGRWLESEGGPSDGETAPPTIS